MANTNAVRHGAYAARLLPDEEEPYEAKRKLFSRALGAMDAFDQQLVHLLAMLAAKVDVAAAKGAKPDAIGPLINQIIQLMRELKATRASRLPEPQGEGKTFSRARSFHGGAKKGNEYIHPRKPLDFQLVARFTRADSSMIARAR